MAALIRNFRSELEQSRALGWFGLGLALIHVLSIYFWWNGMENVLMSMIGYCWPVFPACEALRPFTMDAIWAIRVVYFLLASACALFFSLRRWEKAWWTLLACEVLKLFIFVQDYRFMGNYHYILFLFGMVFLFLRERASVIPTLWVLVYVSAGVLKLNAEWISGAALVAPPIWGEGFIVELQIFVIFIEIVLSWLLLSRSRVLFAIAFFHVAMFHAASYFIVGYFYPVVCFLILGFLFLLARERFPLPRPRGRAAWILLALFVLAQVRFHMASVDGALTGIGRLGALNMFDVNAECEAFGELSNASGTRLEVSFTPRGEAVRIQCDPVIFANFARQICAQVQRGELDGDELRFQAHARRRSGWEWLKIYDTTLNCRGPG